MAAYDGEVRWLAACADPHAHADRIGAGLVAGDVRTELRERGLRTPARIAYDLDLPVEAVIAAGRVLVGRRGIRTPDPILVSTPEEEPQRAVAPSVAAPGAQEERNRAPEDVRGSSPGARLFAQRDPVVARVAEWADQDPAAMRRLLVDEELRAQLLAALEDVVGEDAAPADRRREAAS